MQLQSVRRSTRAGDKRLDYLCDGALITHVHDFARDTRLGTGEWKAFVLHFLVQVGQITTDMRNVHEPTAYPLTRDATNTA